MNRFVLLLLYLILTAPAEAQITVDMAQLVVSPGEQFELPILLSNVEAGQPIQAFEFVLSATGAGVQFVGGNFSGSLVEGNGWTASCNTAISKCLGFSSSQQAFRTSGVLLTLQLIAPSQPGITPVSLNNLRFNGGSPSFTPSVPTTTITVGGGGSGNTAPTAPNGSFPALVIIGGRPEDDAFTISWDPSYDADGDPVSYSIDYALDSAFINPFLSMIMGESTSSIVSVEQAGGIMASGLAMQERTASVGEALTIYGRVTAFDGREFSSGPSSLMTLVRAEIVNKDSDWNANRDVFEVYPNPVQHEMNMTWALQGAVSGRLRIVDALGRLKYETPLDSLSNYGSATRRLDVSSWSPGTYAWVATIAYQGGTQGVYRGTIVKIDS